MLDHPNVVFLSPPKVHTTFAIECSLINNRFEESVLTLTPVISIAARTGPCQMISAVYSTIGDVSTNAQLGQLQRDEQSFMSELLWYFRRPRGLSFSSLTYMRFLQFNLHHEFLT
jgi:hypothetical protein